MTFDHNFRSKRFSLILSYYRRARQKWNAFSSTVDIDKLETDICSIIYRNFPTNWIKLIDVKSVFHFQLFPSPSIPNACTTVLINNIVREVSIERISTTMWNLWSRLNLNKIRRESSIQSF